MFDSLIIGAGTALTLGAFYFLFKKPRKKTHLLIQNAILAILALILFIAFIFGLTESGDSAILLLPLLIVVVPGEFFVIKKLYNNVKSMQNNNFEE